MERKIEKLLALLADAKKLALETQSTADTCYYIGIENAVYTVIGYDKYLAWNAETETFSIE